MSSQQIDQFLIETQKKFSQIERLIFIDICLNYLGCVSRLDIMDEFEIAAAAASKDLNEYRELNQTGIFLNHKEKVTEISDSFIPLFIIDPIIALDVLTNGFNRNKFMDKKNLLKVEFINNSQITQIDSISIVNVTRALYRNKAVKCKYESANSSNKSERVLFPINLFVNNQEWYFRAFEQSEELSQFKNFKISRVIEAHYDVLSEPLTKELIDSDTQWNTLVPIEVKINSLLPEHAQQSIKKDFCMENQDSMIITTRAALFPFIKSNYKIGTKSEIKKQQFLYFELLNESLIDTVINVCQKNHRYANVLATLSFSQNNEAGRHRCAGCAYEAGIRDGLNNEKHSLDELDLPYSQAGTARHRSAQEAYNLGWEKGFEDFSKNP